METTKELKIRKVETMYFKTMQYKKVTAGRHIFILREGHPRYNTVSKGDTVDLVSVGVHYKI